MATAKQPNIPVVIARSWGGQEEHQDGSEHRLLDVLEEHDCEVPEQMCDRTHPPRS